MTTAASDCVFNTDRRIRLGIWGLGRGLSFYAMCRSLNFDVVAGCDYNEHMRRHFLEQNPDAFATADAEEFLAQDFDAVLLATFCPAHAGDAIRCLEAGKHVLSEVTSFHTLAEGVALVEAVERSGLVYNLAENYPYTCANMYLADKWRQGLFGELMYAEYEYVHECRSLCYTYIDGVPVQPGNQVHNWRSWLNFHYYNTHSLGPMMAIAGVRPTRVVSLPGCQRLAGYLVDEPGRGMGGITPSLITMDNGAVVRNLMGATTNDSHLQRLWGTRGAAELNNGVWLRLGASGGSPKFQVNPTWPMLGDLAQTMGHGGGDFWVLYSFARQILFNEPAFFDVYTAADCTIPGILAYRSSLEDGRAFDVPDLRNPAARAQYRHETFAQERFPVDGAFPSDSDPAVTGDFTTVMRDLIGQAQLCRAVMDWLTVMDDMPDPKPLAGLIEQFQASAETRTAVFSRAQTIADAYPESHGARVLREMLEIADPERAGSTAFLAELEAARNRLSE